MEKREKNRRIRRAYLYDRRKAIASYLLITALFFLVAALYDYRQVMRNMVYAAELALFFGVIAAWVDYWHYRARCEALLIALEKEEERTKDLPEAADFPERLYRQLLMKVEEEKRELLTEYGEKQKDMADYYTMWTHQIKTPIAALRLLLQDQRESEELFKIEQYAEMALCFARLDSPSSDFLFGERNVQEIVKDAVRKYSVLFLRSGLRFQMEEFEIRAVTDEKWLGFVVGQVFSNALKYTHEGGIAIYGADAAGNRCTGQARYLVIEDTGIGIRESDLPRIFERGFTGCNGRMDQKATGLGLYLCDKIMRRLGHTIRVESEAGKGTKVILGFEQRM